MRFLAIAAVVVGVSGCSAAAESTTADETALTGASPSIRVRSDRDGFTRDVTSIMAQDEAHLRVENLAPGAEVTLATRTYSPYEANKGYVAEAVFVADATGVVDTSVTPSLRGSYTGVEAEGLMWSSVLADVPEEEVGLDRAGVRITAKVGGAVVASSLLGRTVLDPAVRFERVTANGLVGELFLPPGSEGQVPIVAFGGSEGGIRGGEGSAVRVASWGHPVLALAYFGMAGVPADLSEVPLEYFGKAFAYLDTRPEVQHGKAIVMGGSRGGELALLLGATFPQVVGVVADTPSNYVWGSLDGRHAAWTLAGRRSHPCRAR